MISLRDYQRDRMVAPVRKALVDGFRAPLLVAPTGSGKTACFAFITARMVERKKRIVILVHRDELVQQVSDALTDLDVKHGFITAGTHYDRRYLAHVASVMTLVRRLERVAIPDGVIADECFAPGTMIGSRAIETIKVGDWVTSYNHAADAVMASRVTRIFKSKPSALCTVHFMDGRKLVCTPSHPFFVEGEGYVEIGEAAAGAVCTSLFTVLVGDGYRGHVPSMASSEEYACVLRRCVPGGLHVAPIVGGDGEHESAVCVGANDRAEPDAAAGHSRKGQWFVAGNWSSPEGSRWKWAWDDACARLDAGGAWSRMGSGAHFYDENISWERISVPLQTGHCESVGHGDGRGGRGEPLRIGTAGARSTKNPFHGIARVARVQIHEPTSDGTFGGVLPSRYVHNIEVAGTHNYYADGILVHNCHHTIASTSHGKCLAFWRKLNPKLWTLGVTATPERLSGEGLGEMFDTMILGPTVRELIDAGWLSPYRLFAPESAIDMSALHTRAGDFVRGEMDELMSKPQIIGNVVSHYARLCNGAPGIAFCPSVGHAEKTAERFRAAGFRALSIDGTMAKDIRRGIVSDFRRGALNVLTSCDLVSEGFDIPGIHAVMALRPTQSLGLWLQQVGRGLRPAPGKDAAIILDHVGNSARHGLPDTEREWSLAGRGAGKKNGEPNNAVRQCLKCFAISAAAAVRCVACGELFPVQERKIDEVDGELSEIAVAHMKREAQIAQAMARDEPALIELAKMRGYRNPVYWARHVIAARRQRGRA